MTNDERLKDDLEFLADDFDDEKYEEEYDSEYEEDEYEIPEEEGWLEDVPDFMDDGSFGEEVPYPAYEEDGEEEVEIGSDYKKDEGWDDAPTSVRNPDFREDASEEETPYPSYKEEAGRPRSDNEVDDEEEDSDDYYTDGIDFALDYITDDPSIIEMRTSDYHNSGYRALLATMKLGISEEAPIHENFAKWKPVIKRRIEEYFQEKYVPHTVDPVFLPDRFLPSDAIETARKISKGEVPNTELGRYLSEHKGPIIIADDSIYLNYRAKSWMVKFWMIKENCECELFKGVKES